MTAIIGAPVVRLFDTPQKCAFLSEDETLLLGELEIRHALIVGAQPRPIGFVRRQTLERNQRVGNIVGSLVRHPVADEIAAASWDDVEPALGVCFEGFAAERIELIANKDRDGHRCLLADNRHRASSLHCHVSTATEARESTRTGMAGVLRTVLPGSIEKRRLRVIRWG